MNHRPSGAWGRMLLILTALLPCAASAAVPKEGNDSLDALVFVDERLSAPALLETVEQVEGELEPDVRKGWSGFKAGQEGEWKGHVDRRHGRVDSAEGAGIPFVPGHGNGLTREDISRHLAGKDKPDLAALDRITRSFLPRVSHLLGVDARTLKLNAGRSGNPADFLWFVDYDVEVDGIPVEGTRVVFRVNHGNLIQFGTENLPSPHAHAPKATVDREAALASLSAYIGGFSSSDTFQDGGSLRLLPVASTDRADRGKGNRFAFGRGRELLPVWQFTFVREGDTATWRVRVDAVSGEVVELRDINHYAQANGGVKFNGSSLTYPMPFTNLAGPGGYTNSAGLFNWRSIATTHLNGQYVQIVDTCGHITKTTEADGNLPFGTSAGTDCTTPGTGGPGNTHASRTQFHHLNRAKEIGRGWLPGLPWLSQKVTANVNLQQFCNAFWDGSTLNFFRSGGGCNNTGEIDTAGFHEFGHGLDSNDGNGSSPDMGTGEIYGDFTSAAITHSSCVASGFAGNCGGYGDACTSCTGWRDIDWAKHTSNTPHTVDNFTRVRCWADPGYAGPCGQEGHCESYIGSEALWDFAARDLPGPGTTAAWNVAERLWYLSRSTATSAFTCNTAGIPWTSNGCNTGSLWKTMRAVDDDDGNLANGTPHSANLFAAFNRHGIACTTDAGANTNFRGCTPPAVPNLAALTNSGYNQVNLSWSGSTGRYDVYRSDRSCSAGFVKIQNDRTTTTYTDNDVANGQTYYYMVVAQPSGNEACASAPSVCRTVILPSAALQGYHDIGTCRDIYGWAWDQNRPNTSIYVDLYKDDNFFTTIHAGLFRQDLVNAGKGNGYHGFVYNPGASFRDAQWHVMQVRYGGLATSLLNTPKSIICGVPMFTSQTPAENVSTGGQVYTVGTQFSSTHSGEITHLRYYRAVGESGTNIGKLWTDGGQFLGQVTFPATPASGWVEAELSPHVPITANALYRVAVNNNVQHAKTGCGLSPKITHKVLTAHQGVWDLGNGIFPNTGSCSNFFVDVKFDL